MNPKPMTKIKSVKELIECGVRGGYNLKWSEKWGKWVRAVVSSNALVREATLEEILCDPTFWEAVGKELGWKMACFNCGAKNRDDCVCGYGNCIFTQEWKYRARMWFENRMNGGSDETFLKTLK